MRYQHILLIDDDADDLEIAVSALKIVSNSLIPVTMDNALVALQKLETKALKPDLIFLDLNMPVMPGQQFLIEIKKREDLKDIPIIILSTTSNKTTIELTKTLGAKDFITKPTRFDELVALFKKVLD